MIRNIRAELIKILDESDWMDDETKVVAKEKVTCSFILYIITGLFNWYSLLQCLLRCCSCSTRPHYEIKLLNFVSVEEMFRIRWPCFFVKNVIIVWQSNIRDIFALVPFNLVWLTALYRRTRWWSELAIPNQYWTTRSWMECTTRWIFITSSLRILSAWFYFKYLSMVFLNFVMLIYVVLYTFSVSRWC